MLRSTRIFHYQKQACKGLKICVKITVNNKLNLIQFWKPDSNTTDPSADTSGEDHVEEIKELLCKKQDDHSFYLMHWITKCKSALKIYENVGC